MKKFEQPVVALNEMMMSESISSMCCYSKNTTGTEWGTSQTIVNILNGGTIGSASSHPFIRTNVLQVLGGVVPAPQVHYTYYRAANPTDSGRKDDDGNTIWQSDLSGGSWGGSQYVAQGEAPGIKYTSYDVIAFTLSQFTAHATIVNAFVAGGTSGYVAALKDGNVLGFTGRYPDYVKMSSGKICEHTTTDCPWVQKADSATGGQHINSTTPHAMGGQKWWEAHKAQQYAS